MRHVLNFIRRIVIGIATPSRVSDTFQRDRVKACNVLALSQSVKTVDAIRRLERDVHARLGHSGVEVASNWMLHQGTLLGQLHSSLNGGSLEQGGIDGLMAPAPLDAAPLLDVDTLRDP
jgi:hypothetical protein